MAPIPEEAGREAAEAPRAAQPQGAAGAEVAQQEAVVGAAPAGRREGVRARLPRRAGPKFRRLVANVNPQLNDVPGVGPQAAARLADNGVSTFAELHAVLAREGSHDAFIENLVQWGIMRRWAKVISSALAHYPF